MEDNQTLLPQKSQVELAYIRTTLALDRTLLAWIRTSLTLFGFGFTLARFVHDMALHGEIHGLLPSYPRHLGLALMALGMVTLVGGAVEYVQFRKDLRVDTKSRIFSVSLAVTIILAILAIALIVTLLSEFPSP